MLKKLLTDELFLSPSFFFTGDLKHSVPIEGNALDKISAKSVEESNPAADSRAIIISSEIYKLLFKQANLAYMIHMLGNYFSENYNFDL